MAKDKDAKTKKELAAEVKAANKLKREEAKRKKLEEKEEKAAKRQKKKDKKAKKDPNQPKRPATPFFVFLEEFRKKYKEENPNVKGVAAVGKAGGDKWKSMTEEEKAPYIKKALQKKNDYDKSMTAYKKKQEEEESKEDSKEEKSKGESNDKEDEASEAEEEEEEDEEDEDDE